MLFHVAPCIGACECEHHSFCGISCGICSVGLVTYAKLFFDQTLRVGQYVYIWVVLPSFIYIRVQMTYKSFAYSYLFIIIKFMAVCLMTEAGDVIHFYYLIIFFCIFPKVKNGLEDITTYRELLAKRVTTFQYWFCLISSYWTEWWWAKVKVASPCKSKRLI